MLGVGRGGPRGPGWDEVGGPAPGSGTEGAVAQGVGRRIDAEREPGGPGDAERHAWVVLNEASGVGPATFERLISAFGSALAVLEAACGSRATEMLTQALADADGTATLPVPTANALRAAASGAGPLLASVWRAGLDVLLRADDAYPARLRRVALPPPVLYVRGDVTSLDRPRAVAVVGTRRPTQAGRATAARIADALAGLGATVVSGLAYGIDAAAHTAAVEAGCPTVAVIGGGHERLYPAAHRALVRRMVDGGGAVISEFAPETSPMKGTFPRRNRIISGLSDATVVVEAGARSGALTTAAWALEQGRGLYLVPGRLDDPSVAGSLAFLREAGPEARIVAGIPELLEDLGLFGIEAGAAATRRIATRGAPGAILASRPPVERAIALAIVAGRSSVDELMLATGLGGATVLGALTALEIRGMVLEAFGRYRAAGPLAAAGRPAVRQPIRPRAA
jgi:DNA processing protein